MGEEVLYWWPILDNLVNFMNTKTDDEGNLIFVLDGGVYAGTKGTGKTYPCIEVTWDGETGIKIKRQTQGFVTLWADICIQNSDEDPAAPYSEIHKWQTLIIKLLKEWPSELNEKLNIGSTIEVTHALSDGDIQRPTCISRLIITIDWRITK
ncbi:MAG: hypothetical protein H6Q70_516 [Firmicutes bacterium]|nr:hypothetical protein [Bacillota bacterium]